jgi:hypothetical protein
MALLLSKNTDLYGYRLVMKKLCTIHLIQSVRERWGYEGDIGRYISRTVFVDQPLFPQGH